MGHISYYIAYSDQRSTHNDKLCWEIQLSHHNPPVDHDVIDLIRNSELNDFSSSYAQAGIVLYPDCQFLRCIHMFIKCWVLVWIFWGVQSFSEVDYNIYLSLDKYKPQVEHVKREFEQLRSHEA